MLAAVAVQGSAHAAAPAMTAAQTATALTEAGPAASPSSASTLPVSAFATPALAPEAAATVYTESSLRRAESVFFISLPFCALYSAVLSVGAAAALEGRRLKMDNRIIIPTVSLACLASSYIVWRDHQALPPP